MFDFLMELAYIRRANDTFEGDHSSHEISILPTFYDTPKAGEKKTYTYWKFLSFNVSVCVIIALRDLTIAIPLNNLLKCFNS